MNMAGHDWLLLAWTQAWQVTLLVVLVALFVRAAAANRPQLAFALWLVVFVKCVTPPLWSSPGGAFCWLQPPQVLVKTQGDEGGCRETVRQDGSRSADNLLRPPPVRRTITIGALADVGPRDYRDEPPVRVLDRSHSWPLSAKRPAPARNATARQKSGHESPHSEDAQTPGPEPSLPTGSTRSSIVMPQPETLLACLWGAGAFLLLCLTLRQRLRFARLLSRANRGEDIRCREALARLSSRLRLRQPVRLIVTDRLVGPAVAGLRRPTVILPRAVIEQRSAEELELMLAHELIHVRRGDLWFGLLRSAAKLIWWFHPLVWWASRQASREAERCCDEAVLAELQCGPGRYARCLLDVLETKQRLRCVPACPGVGAIEIAQGRLERIMRLDKPSHRRTPWWCWAVAILAAAAALPGAAIGISNGTPSKTPSKRDEPKPVAAAASSAAIRSADSEGPTAALAEEPKPLIQPAVRRRPSPFPEQERTRRSEPTLAPPRSDIDRALTREPVPTPVVSAFDQPTPAPRRSHSRYADRGDISAAEPASPRYPSRDQPDDLARPRRSFGTRRPSGDYQDGLRTYVVEDVLAVIGAERKMDQQKSAEFLKHLLKSQVQQSVPSEIGLPKNTIDAAAAVRSGPLPIDQIPIDILWRGNSIEAETTAEGHRRIERALNTIRRYGVGEIRIIVQFLSGPAEEIKKAKLKWTVLPTELPPSAAPNLDGPNDWRSTPRGDGFFDDRPRANRTQYITEKCPPMIYDILADDFAAKLLHQYGGVKRLNVLESPHVTFFNGQSGFASDCSLSPFVVAVKDGKPQIRVVHEGTIVRFRPLAEDQDKLRVDFQVEFSKIGTVETAELSESYEGKPITIQIPEVSATRVEGSVDLPWNQWLLLGGVEAINGGKKPITMVMLRAEKIEPFRLPPKQEPIDAVASPGPARFEPFHLNTPHKPRPVDAAASPGPTTFAPASY
jgi:beta-lactamase regulating signal transducer with metallopeptidase domain